MPALIVTPRTEAELVADKLTQQIIDALTRVAAEPGGLPLYASKAEAGLFPNTVSAKPAAQKCLADGLLRATAPDPKAKAPRDRFTLTEKGWEFLLAAVNPKQVLEDFVRVLEARRGEVGELLDTARRMADSLQGLKDAVARVLPCVNSQRIERREPVADTLPSPPTSPRGRGEGQEMALALPGAPATPDLAPAICAYLADHTGPTDCTLPELFRALALTDAPTIGAFHDCLRALYADGTVSLPAWTGPLYALPEPQFALLIGHGIAYYASLREAGVRRQDRENRAATVSNS